MAVKVRQKRPGKNKPWWIFVTHKGRRVSVSIGDKKAAQAAATEIEKRLATGDLGVFAENKKKEEPQKQTPIFENYVKEEWERKYVLKACKHSVIGDYASIMKTHLMPRFRLRPMDSFTVDDVVNLISDKLDDGHRKKTVLNIKYCLSSVLSYAVEMGVIPFNPVLQLGRKTRRLLSISKTEKQANVDFFAPVETSEFLEAVWAHGTLQDFAFFMVSLRAGLRLGEVIALCPKDIHFHERYIDVTKAIVRRELGPTKTQVPRRVDMSPQLAMVLRAHLQDVPRQMKENGWRTPPKWLFFNKQGNFIDADDYRDRTYNEIFKKENELRESQGKSPLRRITIHQLRHTFASTLIRNRENVKYIQEQMGHASIQVTYDIYGHLVPGENKDAVGRLDDPGLTMFGSVEGAKVVSMKDALQKPVDQLDDPKLSEICTLSAPCAPEMKKEVRTEYPNLLLLLKLRGQDLNLRPSGYEKW